RRPRVSSAKLFAAAGIEVDPVGMEWAEIELKYSGYIARERAAAERLNRMHDLQLPSTIEYQQLDSLTSEARQKLTLVQPKSLGDAARISGITPSDLQNLVVAVLKHRRS
ncbi:MAG TPA: hypothetical protein VMY76_15385, partial [Gemmatimonadales bacterium]|nr:hypothetical protein [Gemmatimonadales bacterium]